MLSIIGVCVSCWESNGRLPPCEKWWLETENWSTTPFGYFTAQPLSMVSN